MFPCASYPYVALCCPAASPGSDVRHERRLARAPANVRRHTLQQRRLVVRQPHHRPVRSRLRPRPTQRIKRARRLKHLRLQHRRRRKLEVRHILKLAQRRPVQRRHHIHPKLTLCRQQASLEVVCHRRLHACPIIDPVRLTGRAQTCTSRTGPVYQPPQGAQPADPVPTLDLSIREGLPPRSERSGSSYARPLESFP